MCNSTNFLRLTLSQYGKAFSLSATPVAYLLTSGINTPLFRGIDCRAFCILKH